MKTDNDILSITKNNNKIMHIQVNEIEHKLKRIVDIKVYIESSQQKACCKLKAKKKKRYKKLKKIPT